MSFSKITWHKIATTPEEISWQTNNMCVITIDNKKITLAIFQNKIFAFAYKCPHASGILANGNIDAIGNVVCPLHRYKFNMQNGRNTSGEGYFLKNYAVQTNKDGIFIGIETKGLFS